MLLSNYVRQMLRDGTYADQLILRDQSELYNVDFTLIFTLNISTSDISKPIGLVISTDL